MIYSFSKLEEVAEIPFTAKYYRFFLEWRHSLDVFHQSLSPYYDQLYWRFTSTLPLMFKELSYCIYQLQRQFLNEKFNCTTCLLTKVKIKRETIYNRTEKFWIFSIALLPATWREVTRGFLFCTAQCIEVSNLRS